MKQYFQPPRLYFSIPILVFLVAFLGRTLFYYQGLYLPPNVPTSEVDRVQALSEPLQSAPIVGDGADVVLIDNSHLNRFSDEEMTAFFGRITAAGGRVEMILPLHDDELEERLREAKAFVVLANQEFYEQDELNLLEKFVENGGRLLIVGDPTRVAFVNAINSLAGHFGVIYEDDYIYNLVENDGNYLNVILRDFAESPVTEGIDEIVVRAAHSMRVAEGGIAFGDANTFSSLRETPGDVTAAAITADGNVLALPDLTFLTGPYNTFADNDIFIDNVVSFLLNGERQYELLDFPYYFDEVVEVAYTDSGLLENSFAEWSLLREELENQGVIANLANNFLPGEQAVLVSRYGDLTNSMLNILAEDGIRVRSTGTISIGSIGEFQSLGSALFHLHKDAEGRYQLFILADTTEALQRGLTLLFEDHLGTCLLRANTALCVPATLATPTPTPTPTRTPFATSSPGEGTPDGEGEPTPELTPEPTETPAG